MDGSESSLNHAPAVNSNAAGALPRNRIVLPARHRLLPFTTIISVAVGSGHGLVDLDLAILKQTRISEGLDTQFRVEIFNAANHPNFSQPVNTVFAGFPAVPNPLAGRILSTSTSSRQLQFGLKLIF